MSDENRTCARCGRIGTRQFYRVANRETGIAEWQCANWAPCQERERQRTIESEVQR